MPLIMRGSWHNLTLKGCDMKLSMIAAVDQNMGIGKNNQLLCYLPNDLKRFKQITMGLPIIMGRKTFQSIGKPLPGRRNIVLSKRHSEITGVEVYQDIAEALSKCQKEAEVMVIGGETLYRLLINKADRLYLTHIHATFDADVFFPTVLAEQWKVIGCEHVPKDEKNAYSFELKIYQKQ